MVFLWNRWGEVILTASV